MENRATKVILAGVAAIAVTTSVSAVIGAYQDDTSLTPARNAAGRQATAAPTASAAPQQAAGVEQNAAPEQDAQNQRAAKEQAAKEQAARALTAEKRAAERAAAERQAAKKAAAKKAAAKALPSGTATATSFWDASTASGRPMSFRTIASPYWPLGTRVKITYRGKSAIGVVDDFGPAEWAVAQHDIPAILDLSEEMMRSFTGVRSNTVHAHFQVLSFGKGRSYRTSGTGHGLAYGKSK